MFRLTSCSRLHAKLTPGFVRCWVSLFTRKSRTQHPLLNAKYPCRQAKIKTALLAYTRTGFVFLGSLKQAGSCLAWARLASNPYPKAFFVSTSVCLTRNDEEASCCPHLHSGN